MALPNGNPLIDAETTLVGWTNRSAIRGTEHTFLSGEEVLLNTKLDAAARFSLVASHPGAPAAVEVELLLAPVLRDGTTGSWISAIRVALPAEGGRVEAFLSGHDIQIEREASPAQRAAIRQVLNLDRAGAEENAVRGLPRHDVVAQVRLAAV